MRPSAAMAEKLRASRDSASRSAIDSAIVESPRVVRKIHPASSRCAPACPFRNSALTAVNATALRPIPTASVRTASAEKPGRLVKARNAPRRSCRKPSIPYADENGSGEVRDLLQIRERHGICDRRARLRGPGGAVAPQQRERLGDLIVTRGAQRLTDDDPLERERARLGVAAARAYLHADVLCRGVRGVEPYRYRSGPRREVVRAGVAAAGARRGGDRSAVRLDGRHGRRRRCAASAAAPAGG